MQIWDKIKRKKYISFDIFDTLIKRNVSHPSDIFSIVAATYYAQYGEDISDFPEKRKCAEKICREKASREEIVIQEIYSEIEYPTDICSLLCEIEIKTEQQFCQRNFSMVKVFERCINEGKKVVLISDMYLPESIVVQILKSNGIVGYEKLYLSSSIGLQKGTGNLYEFVLDDLKISSRDIVHIGDGIVTDFIRPNQAGIRGIHVKRNPCNLKFVKKRDILGCNKLLWSYVNNNVVRYSKESEIFRLGYEAFGPLILGFSLWVHNKMQGISINRAYFLSRDMYLFLDVYCKLFPDDDIRYLEVSRRSLRKAFVLTKASVKSVLDTIGRRKYTVSEICDILDIDFEKVKEQCSVHGIEGNTQFDGVINNKEKYYKFNIVILDELKKQTDFTVEYLSQEGILDNKPKVIVDIGWHGTIQNMLEEISSQQMKGLYLGNTRRKNYRHLDSEGYWFDSDDELQTLNNISIVGILETMLFPNIGTTIGYKKDGNSIVPIYRESEALSYDKIKEFQDGALAFLKDILGFAHKGYLGIELFKFFDMTSETCMESYVNMSYRPTLKVAKNFGNLDYEDNRIMKLAKPRGMLNYLVNPKVLLRDYRDCKWKVGFIKQILPFITRPDAIDVCIKKINNL